MEMFPWLWGEMRSKRKLRPLDSNAKLGKGKSGRKSEGGECQRMCESVAISAVHNCEPPPSTVTTVNE